MWPYLKGVLANLEDLVVEHDYIRQLLVGDMTLQLLSSHALCQLHQLLTLGCFLPLAACTGNTSISHTFHMHCLMRSLNLQKHRSWAMPSPCSEHIYGPSTLQIQIESIFWKPLQGTVGSLYNRPLKNTCFLLHLRLTSRSAVQQAMHTTV